AREHIIITRMGPTVLPPRGTGESGRLSHIQFLSELSGYRRAWQIYFRSSGGTDRIMAYGFAPFQIPGRDRAIVEIRNLEAQPLWLRQRVFEDERFILEQIDNNIDRIEQILLANE